MNFNKDMTFKEEMEKIINELIEAGFIQQNKEEKDTHDSGNKN